MNQNNFDLEEGPNALKQENKDKLTLWYAQKDNFLKEVQSLVKEYNSVINNKKNLIKNLNQLDFEIKNNESISNNKLNQILIDNYGLLKNLIKSLNDINKQFEELNIKYDSIKQNLISIKTDIINQISIKNKNQNNNKNHSYVLSSFYQVKDLYTKLIKQSDAKVNDLKKLFNDPSTEDLNKLLSKAKFNIKKSLIEYFNKKINNKDSELKTIIINPNNNDNLYLENLLKMKDIIVQIKKDFENLLKYYNPNNNLSNININSNNKNTLQNSMEKINDKFNQILNDYKKIIKSFENKTKQSIKDLGDKIKDLIEEIKRLIENFKEKHKDFGFNFKIVNEKIQCLDNLNQTVQYQEKLQNILNSLFNGIENNKKTGENVAGNDINNNSSTLSVENIYSKSNTFTSNNNLKSQSKQNYINNKKKEKLKISFVKNPLKNRSSVLQQKQIKYSQTKKSNLNPINNSTVSNLTNNENNNLSLNTINKMKSMNNLTENAILKKKNIIKKYGNNETQKLIKSKEIQNVRSKLSSNLSMKAKNKNGQIITNLLPKRKELLEKFNNSN